MAQPEEVQAGRLYKCNKKEFSNKIGTQNVVVIVAEYSDDRRNPRALVAAAEVKKAGQRVDIRINLDELHTVPILKLEVIDPILDPKKLEGWKAKLKERIDQD